MKKFNRLFAVMLLITISGCIKKGEITNEQDRFTGKSIITLELGLINSTTSDYTRDYVQNKDSKKKQRRILEKGEFSGNAKLVKEENNYFFHITQPNCPGGKVQNQVIFLVNNSKINSSLSQDSKKIEFQQPATYTAYGVISGYYICNEIAIIGPLPKIFFNELHNANSLEFKIYNNNYATMSRLNKAEIDMINNFVK